MTEEGNFYNRNNQVFVEELQNSFVEKIIFWVDESPAFDITAVPFKFQYLFSFILVTDRGDFEVLTSTTSEGFETFWIRKNQNKKNSGEFKIINASIKRVVFKTIENFEFSFKMTLEFDEYQYVFFCGEIYDMPDGLLSYKANDEMLLAFNDNQEAIKFEKLIYSSIDYK